MSNFGEYKVCFDNLTLLIEHAARLRYALEFSALNREQLNSTRLYEAETLANVVGEMRCLINEVNRRVNYLKNTVSDDI